MDTTVMREFVKSASSFAQSSIALTSQSNGPGNWIGLIRHFPLEANSWPTFENHVYTSLIMAYLSVKRKILDSIPTWGIHI